MEKDRQNKIDQLIGQFGDVQRLTPNPFLLTRIRQNIENRKARQAKERKGVIVFASTMALFIGLNIFSFKHFNQNFYSEVSGKTAVAQALVKAYDLDISEY